MFNTDPLCLTSISISLCIFVFLNSFYYCEIFLITILLISLHFDPKYYSFIFKNLSTISYVTTWLQYQQNLFLAYFKIFFCVMYSNTKSFLNFAQLPSNNFLYVVHLNQISNKVSFNHVHCCHSFFSFFLSLTFEETISFDRRHQFRICLITSLWCNYSVHPVSCQLEIRD